MEIRRVDKKDVVENLELIYKDKNFSIPTTTTKGAFFVGGKKIKEEDIKYANYKGVEYKKTKALPSISF
jgi:predicted ThiF/HesA family dinucleotide-utilizing enzyme